MVGPPKSEDNFRFIEMNKKFIKFTRVTPSFAVSLFDDVASPVVPLPGTVGLC